MGGGGLDYYDTKMLLLIGGDRTRSSPIAERPKKIDELKQGRSPRPRRNSKPCAASPQGNEPGPDGRPKRAIARQKMNKLQTRIAGADRPGGATAPAALGVRDAQDHRRHRDPHPRRGREARPDRAARLLSASSQFAGQPTIDPEPERPAGTGPVAHQPAKPAHAARDRQSRLAAPVRRRAGATASTTSA